MWQWEDPLTSLYTRWEQRQLANEYEVVVKQERSRPPLVARGADSEVAQRPSLMPPSGSVPKPSRGRRSADSSAPDSDSTW